VALRGPKAGAPFVALDPTGRHATIMKSDGTPASQADMDGWCKDAMDEKAWFDSLSDADKRRFLDGNLIRP
jgi:hypothetical protein